MRISDWSSDVCSSDLVACRPYMFTASLPPSIIASTRSALQRLDNDKHLRTQLMDNAKQLHNGLHDLGLEVGPHISPVVSVALDAPEVAVRFWSALERKSTRLKSSH